LDLQAKNVQYGLLVFFSLQEEHLFMTALWIADASPKADKTLHDMRRFVH